MTHKFHTKMCQEASDMFGSGKHNSAFKIGAEWTYKEMKPMMFALRQNLERVVIIAQTTTAFQIDAKGMRAMAEAKQALLNYENSDF